MRRTAWIAVLLIARCASSPSGPHPDIELVQTSSVAEVARNMTGSIQVSYRVTIHNTLSSPITLKRVELQSLGDGAYTLGVVSRSYDAAIPAGASQAFELWGSAFVSRTISGANGPVTIRAIAQFETPDGSFQTVVMRQVQGVGD